MNRRHYLALTGSVAFAGCSGDTSGIISNDSSEPGTSDSRSAVENQSSQSDQSDQSLIETTFEGTGQSLREMSIKNNGLTFIQVDSPGPITITIVDSEGGLSNRLRLSYPSIFSRGVVDIISGEYAFNIQPDSEVDWSITIEDHPTYSDEEVGASEFPIKISGNNQQVFGPFLLDGFIQPRLRTNATMTLRFIDQKGETIHGVSVDIAHGDYSESFVEFEPTTIDGHFWITSAINARYSGAVDLEDIFFDFQLVAPENS